MRYSTKDSYARRIKKFASTLGESEEEIYASMERLGIRGIPREMDSCVLAVAFQREFPELRKLSIGYEVDCMVEFDHRARVYSVLLPEQFANFVNQFDTGAFPSLVVDG